MNIDDLISGGSATRKRSQTKPQKSATALAKTSSTAGKRQRNNGSTDAHAIDIANDEDDLLALALGTSTSGIRDADQYEESVLRDAEMSITPRLMTNSTNNNNEHETTSVASFGFPSLNGLAPSRSVHADLGDVRNVLRQLRKGSKHNGSTTSLLTTTKECLKEQMLLALMQSASGDPEMGVFPQQEAKQEWKRRKLYRDGKGDGSHPITKTKNNRTMNENNNYNNKNNRIQQALAKAGETADDDNDITNETPEGRLEGIKKSGARPKKKKSVGFASDVKGPAPSGSSKPKSLLSKKVLKLKPKAGRRRVSIQERRRRQEGGAIDNEDNDNDNEHDKDDMQITREEIVNQLKELRIEREQRRKQRKVAWRDGNDNDNANVDDDSSEEEFEFAEEEKFDSEAPSTAPAETILPEAVASSTQTTNNLLPEQPPVPDAPSSAVEIDNITAEADTNTDFKEENTSACPLCGEDILVPEISTNIKTEEGDQSSHLITMDDEKQRKSHRDAFLAQHMSACQTQRPSRRRRGGSTLASTTHTARGLPIQSRRERTRASRPNYAEAESDEENAFAPAATRSNRQTRRMDSHMDDDNDDEDMYRANGEINEEEEFMDDDLVIDDDDKEIIAGKSTRSKARAKRSSRARSTRKSAPRKQPSSKSRPPPLDDWYEEDYEDRVDEWIDRGREKMVMMEERDADEIAPGEVEYEGGLIVPAWTNDRLFPYQRTGLQWMWELHRQQSGGILGDEMGLGKTIQVASFLGSMTASRKVKSILIISPATMLQHWLKEMAKWAPGVRRILIHQSGDTPSSHPSLLHNTMGQRKITTQHLNDAFQWLKTSRRNRLFEIIDEADLDTRDPSSFCGTAYAFVTTFENVRRNEDIWTNHRWSYVVIDEAQKIRNPTADITLVCKRLKTPHRLALSGTPIQNDLRELWSIFDFVFPGRLGTLPAFETEFADPIKRGGYSNASPMQVQLSYRCALLLKDLINPYLLRRLKKDIKEVQRMPGKKEQVLFCRLSDQQRSMYEAFLRSDYVKKVFKGSAQLLGAITVMRKICNHPDLVSNPDNASVEPFLQNDLWYSSEITARQREKAEHSSDDDNDGIVKEEDDGTTDEDLSMIQRSGKLDILAKILPLWKKQGHRVLIFCQWKKMLDILMAYVVSKGWKFSRLDGNTNVASRQRLVDTFNSDESIFGMLCTTRTGGVGLNLVGANRIILYDPDWNPQTDAQARERAWRFGQKREVTVFRMICAGTVEEKIYQRQIFKTAISNSVLQNSKQRRLFTKKDLKDLFSLKADNGSIVSGAVGVTETAHLTKGDGYVNPDDELATRSNQEDDGETMRTVLRSNGLAGIFDHDVVEGKSKGKKASVREMEARAKQIAREALQNLQQSVQQEQSPFDRGSRFGAGTAQSNNLLSSIANRNAEITNATSMRSLEETKQHTQLLKDLHNFIHSGAPTTDELLNEFSSQMSTLDAAVFRKLLKSIATLHNGRWILK